MNTTTLCLIITIAGWGLYHNMAKLASRSLPPAAVQLVACMCACAIAPIYYALLHKSSNVKWNIPGVGWAIAAGMASIIGTFAYIYVLSQKDVSQTVSIVSSYPALTFVVAVFFMGEAFSIARCLGLILVLAGAFVASRG